MTIYSIQIYISCLVLLTLKVTLTFHVTVRTLFDPTKDEVSKKILLVGTYNKSVRCQNVKFTAPAV